MFLERERSGLDPQVSRYLEACLDGLFSFHEIMECEPGRGFKARDLFTAEEFDVMERSASETLKVHDIIFGELVRIDGIAMLEGCAPFNLEPESKLSILDLRNEILPAKRANRRELVREYDIELRELYLAMTAKYLNPAMPELHNTDGEPFVPHRLIFNIDSPQEAYEALKDLAAGETATDFLASAERGRDGELRRIEFPWIKTKRLGEHARFKATEIQSVERMMAERANGPTERSADHAELMAKPEVQAHLNSLLAAHYEQWVTEKVPALGNKTPLQMVRSAKGRERVEALLLGIERRNARLAFPPDPAILRRLRERLGLGERK